MTPKIAPSLSPEDLNQLHEKPEVRVKDRVRTKTNRLGVVRRRLGTTDQVIVEWDDGHSFPIRDCHLEVLARNWDIPPGTKAS